MPSTVTRRPAAAPSARSPLTPQQASVTIQRVWRGWMVRRSIVHSVRDEFAEITEEVQRKGMVQALREQQQQLADKQNASAAWEETRSPSHAAAVALASTSFPSPVYDRATLCRPHWVKSARPSPKSSPPAAIEHEAAEQKEAEEESKAQHAGDDDAAVSSEEMNQESVPKKVNTEAAAAEPSSSSIAPAGANSERPLAFQILSVQAAIRQRLLQIRHADPAAEAAAAPGSLM